VVFDKVRENVRDIKSSTTRTYSEAANLAINQVLVRSINTTLIGVLPVSALLFAGAAILGQGPLKDLALALFVGMISGAYSSIFIATPMLAQLKERDPEMKKLAARVATRRAREGQKSGVVPGQPVLAGATGNGRSAVRTQKASGALVAEHPESPDEPPGPAEPGLPISLGPAGDIGRIANTGAAKRPQPQHKPRSQRKR
jgi:preprotein translocase subunit SecF